MNKKMWSLKLVVLSLLLISFAIPALGQENVGTIRGTVYRDININSQCSNEGEVRLGGIPIEIVNDDTDELIRLTTAADGTYTFTSAELGLWSVTVVPGTGWRVTSQQTVEVVITEDQPEVAGVDFCIVEVDNSNGGGVTLPESGAPMAPQLIIAAAAGLALMVIGAGLFLRGQTK